MIYGVAVGEAGRGSPDEGVRGTLTSGCSCHDVKAVFQL